MTDRDLQGIKNALRFVLTRCREQEIKNELEKNCSGRTFYFDGTQRVPLYADERTKLVEEKYRPFFEGLEER